MRASQFEGWGPDRLAQELDLSTLRAVHGPWRLPCWPTPADLRKQLSSVWRPWAHAVRLQGRALWVGTSKFERLVPEVCSRSAAPEERGRLECSMRAATRDRRVLVADDRDAGKAWAMSDVQMFLGMMHGLLQDHATWEHRPDITPEGVTTYLWARARLGLPAWLRRSSSTYVVPVHRPTCSC